MPQTLAAFQRHMRTPSLQTAAETNAASVAEPPEAADAAVSAAADVEGPAHPAAQQAAGGVQGGAEGDAAASEDRGALSDGEPGTSKPAADSAADGAAAPLQQQEVLLSCLPVEPLPLSSVSS
jgi:hypothetical protein